ncbi:MAG: M28 family peptidase [Kiritimatiellae bacterium]|nr:M28 family peptidase [Kiritimatiellia bacterium]
MSTKMLSLLLAAAFSFTRADASLSYSSAEEIVKYCTPRDAGTPRGEIAANRILDMVSSTGADARKDSFFARTPLGRRRFNNVYAEFEANPTSSWVVVVSHFDTKSGIVCPGANDGASTTGLLIGLANALVDRPIKNINVMLIWTDGEESLYSYGENDGLQGSIRAVSNIEALKRNVKAVICVDMLGDKDLNAIIPANGTKELTEKVLSVAASLGLSSIVSKSNVHVKDDHQPFLDRGFPAVNIIDFSYGPKNSWWHTSSDTMDKISEESLFKAGSLVAGVISSLAID